MNSNDGSKNLTCCKSLGLAICFIQLLHSLPGMAMLCDCSGTVLQSLRGCLPPGISVGAAWIHSDNANSLMPEEAVQLQNAVHKVKAASGTARLIVRDLLKRAGSQSAAVVRGPNGCPTWPSGFAGSLAHDDQVAVAALARISDIQSIGIDVEPAKPLPSELVEFIETENERAVSQNNLVISRLHFSVKEAVYKALNPLDHCFLDFKDIEVRLYDRIAVVGGRGISIRFQLQPRIVSFAYVI